MSLFYSKNGIWVEWLIATRYMQLHWKPCSSLGDCHVCPEDFDLSANICQLLTQVINFFFLEAISPFLSFTTVFWLVREYWQISWCLLCSTERHYCYATSRNLQQSLANQSGNTHFPLATRVCQGAFNQSLNLCDWRLYSFKFKHNDIII